jgi:dienelactone hydrolase
MKTETVEYKDGNVTLRGYVALDDAKSSKRPGILVMPEALGLGAHAKQRAERLAALGYVALAGDPYGNGLELGLDKSLSMPQVDSSRVAAIGYCMGGSFGLELARDGAPIKGVVTFHSGLQTQRPAAAGEVKAKILVNTGADDPLVPFEQIGAFANEMTKAGADWQIISYGGTKHSFTNPEANKNQMPALAYNKLSDQRSWNAMVSFFNEIFA